MSHRFYGHISYFNQVRGWGRIRTRSEDEVYFNIRDVFYYGKFLDSYGAMPFKVGAKVSFVISRTDAGRYAKDVCLVTQKSNVQALERLEYLELLDAKTEIKTPNDEPTERKLESSSDSKLIALGVFENRIKLVTITPDGRYKYLDEQDTLHRIVYISLSKVLSLQSAIEEFEYLINKPYVQERELQDFFKRFPDFILNDDYKEAHSHVVLSRSSGELLIPDFVLEPVTKGSLCDLLELKLPRSDIYVMQKNRMRYSSAVFEAAAQLREYNRYFDDEANRRRFHESYPNLDLYKPRMFVLIGRLGSATAYLKRDIEMDLPHLNLRTYDEVLARMNRKLRRMTEGR